jgi:hypothetical protein
MPKIRNILFRFRYSIHLAYPLCQSIKYFADARVFLPAIGINCRRIENRICSAA